MANHDGIYLNKKMKKNKKQNLQINETINSKSINGLTFHKFMLGPSSFFRAWDRLCKDISYLLFLRG